MEQSNCFTGLRETGLMDQISGLSSYSTWCTDSQSMAFEDRKRCLSSMGVREGGQKDQFPIGMRVLAVDDDPVCLKLLEVLLLRCQYNVTTTNQAITALKMLRENRDKFDLVISDVHMPDMDGFKLLELVGLEMDLPVIMMSVNGETKTVMKGITHGACDYLIKPVRIEELRNIWQHVVRRRKFDNGDYNNYDNREEPGKPHNLNSESEKGQHTEGSSDHSGKLSRKRKDQDEEDEDDSEENLHENEDSSTQKKPRVVWSIELHRKFVAAVNQLGIDKAVPKRILELMNVEKLTRENVASHLQKYRLYLKRLSAVASQQANLVAAFGSRDTPYLHMGSSDGFGNFQALSTSAQLPSLTSFQPNGVIRRPNSTAPGFQSLASSGLIQAGGTHTNISIPLISKIQQIDRSGSQQGSLIQGIPTSLELEQLRRNRTQDINNNLPGVFSSNSLPAGGSTNTFVDITDGSLLSQAQKQQRGSSDLSSHSSKRILSTCSGSLQVTLPDLSRCSDAWQDGDLDPGYMTKALPTVTSGHHVDFPKISANVHISQRESNTLSLSNMSSSAIVSPQVDPSIRRDIQCQANYLNRSGMILPGTAGRDSRLINFSNGADPKFKAEELNQNNLHEHGRQCNSVAGPTSSCNYLLSSGSWDQRMSGSHLNSILDQGIVSDANTSSSLLMAKSKVDKTIANSQLNCKDNHILETPKAKGVVSNGCMLDDIVGSMIKPERDDILLMDNDLGCDFYSLGACM